MSSSNKTALLQLNQWAAADPVLREDFNADNAKLEAAVGGMVHERIKTVTTSAAAPVVSLDLSDIDWEQYLEVHIALENFAMSNPSYPTTGGKTVDAKLNDPSKGAYYSTHTSSNYNFSTAASAYMDGVTGARNTVCTTDGDYAWSAYGHLTIIPQPSRDTFAILVQSHMAYSANTNPNGYYQYKYYTPAYNTLKLSEFSSLNFYIVNNPVLDILAGAEIHVWGVKK